MRYSLLRQREEPVPIPDDGSRDQAAAGRRSVATITSPSVNLAPDTTLGSWSCPSRRCKLFCAAATSLNIVESVVVFERQPSDLIVP